MVDVLIIEPMYASKVKNLLVRKSADFLSGSPVVLREPIAAEYLAGYLRFKGLSTDVIQHTTEGDNVILNLIEKENPKILGVSIHSTHIFPKVLDFLRKCKQKFPNIVIVCGGNHPTCEPDIVKEDCIDYVVSGEGEEALYELTLALLQGKSVEHIKSLSFMKNACCMHNSSRDRI